MGVASAESQDRTDDTAIFSRVLYQLSYLGLKVQYLFPERRLFYLYVDALSRKLYSLNLHNHPQAGIWC
jgi:hypothetical protein